MKILLSSVRDARKVFRDSLALQLEGLEDRVKAGQVEVEVTVDPAGDRWHLVATLRGVFPFRCDRCRRRYAGELKGEFSLVVLARPVSGFDPAEDETVVQLPSGSQELDLSRQINEALWLDLPMVLDCAEATGEACPAAGRMEEQAVAASDEPAMDPRWGPLAELKKRLESGGKQAGTPEDQSED